MGLPEIVAVHEVMAVHQPCGHLNAERLTSITLNRPDRERPETYNRDTDAPKILDFQEKKVEASAPRHSQITPHS
jgi:hypothetical protein